MDFEALTIYARVAELASFTKAAEQLGVQTARVSTSVQALETELAPGCCSARPAASA